jgi:hypothetical protein
VQAAFARRDSFQGRTVILAKDKVWIGRGWCLIVVDVSVRACPLEPLSKAGVIISGHVKSG